MRPPDRGAGAELYECPVCGARSDAGEARVCADCGVRRLNLGVGRDL